MTSVSEQESVIDFIHERAVKYADHPALSIKENDKYREITYRDLSQRAVSLASYLIESGIQQGDRIAILSESKPEWGISFFSCVRSGAIVVPLDIKLTETELVSILSDCLPTTVFCDSKHTEIIDRVAEKVKSIKNIYNVDVGVTDEKHPNIESLKPKQIVEGRARALDETALIVYTSGTTGSPKGVMTTFGNIIFEVSAIEESFHISSEDRFLSILPPNHLLELTAGMLGVLNQGGTVVFCHTLFPQEIVKAMKEKQITGMVGVPLFFRSLKGAIEREVKKKGDEALQAFRMGLEKADAVPLEQRAKMFQSITDQFGGKLRVFICGGAPLDIEVALFFQRLGIPVCQGYGLTETSPVITGNTPNFNRVGTVGPALPGVEVRIDNANGDEILTRGPHVMKGYYKRDDLTKEVIDAEGWFHTGDVGHLDDEACLLITGRIKNLIVLGGGKKVFPEEVETALAACPAVKELCVVPRKSADGFKEGTEEVAVVVVPSDAVIEETKDNPDSLRQVVKKHLDTLAAELAPYKRPSFVYIYDGELPKTATRKVKRNLVVEWLQQQK